MRFTRSAGGVDREDFHGEGSRQRKPSVLRSFDLCLRVSTISPLAQEPTVSRTRVRSVTYELASGTIRDAQRISKTTFLIPRLL